MILNRTAAPVPLRINGEIVVLPPAPVKQHAAVHIRELALGWTADVVRVDLAQHELTGLPEPQLGTYLIVRYDVARLAAAASRRDCLALNGGSYRNGAYESLWAFAP